MDVEAPFLFRAYWPFLKFFQLIGCFPCARSISEEGVTTLRPLNSIIVVFLYTCTWIVIGFITTITFYFLPNWDGLLVSHKLSDIRSSVIDWIVQIAIVTTLFLLHFSLLIFSLNVKHKMCTLQDYVTSNFPSKDRYLQPFTSS